MNFNDVDVIPTLTYRSTEESDFQAASHGKREHTMRLIQRHLQELAKFPEEALQEAFDEDENASVVAELIAAADAGGDQASTKAMDLSGGEDNDSNDVELDESEERRMRLKNRIQKTIQYGQSNTSTSMESRYWMLGLGASWAAKRSKLKVRRKKGRNEQWRCHRENEADHSRHR